MIAGLIGFVAAAVLMVGALNRPSSNLAVLAGLFFSLAVWQRRDALVFVPFLAIALLDRRYPVRARAHLAGSALLGLALGLLPWAFARH